ncbi:uncharacterized protein CIMG_10095 [Coccidioides immitis RS]|uniref:Uncharacterized protein n=1 Tax=Coccidioides immitis (strain RS) TaxID=246410 RepID=J3K0T1_COCIM|nr:uncharacterized protein CIMG_10095 [Coccidioides immitis RS]EAS27490.3 hypothetical protein CIMG_10095 [Coccidioides immitis RS]
MLFYFFFSFFWFLTNCRTCCGRDSERTCRCKLPSPEFAEPGAGGAAQLHHRESWNRSRRDTGKQDSRLIDKTPKLSRWGEVSTPRLVVNGASQRRRNEIKGRRKQRRENRGKPFQPGFENSGSKREKKRRKRKIIERSTRRTVPGKVPGYRSETGRVRGEESNETSTEYGNSNIFATPQRGESVQGKPLWSGGGSTAEGRRLHERAGRVGMEPLRLPWVDPKNRSVCLRPALAARVPLAVCSEEFKPGRALLYPSHSIGQRVEGLCALIGRGNEA